MKTVANLLLVRRRYPRSPNVRLDISIDTLVISDEDREIYQNSLSSESELYHSNFLIVDDLGEKGSDCELRRHYEDEFIAKESVRTLMEFPVEPTPCISWDFSYKQNGQYNISVADSSTCKNAWSLSTFGMRALILHDTMQIPYSALSAF